MRYREIRPPEKLAQSVECFWTLEGRAPAGPAAPERVLPDGCIELIFNFGEPFAEHGPRGMARQPRFFAVGQMDRPIRIAPTGRVDLLGVRFQPSGAFSFLQLPVHELTGRVVPLEDVARPKDRPLLQRMREGQRLSERARTFEKLFLSRTQENGHGDPGVDGGVYELLRAGGCVRVEGLAQVAGLSRRQLERRFRERVGIGPKLLSRILRFQRVLRAFEAAANWAGAAADCGYYDQSHLIRDFRQFTGECPTAIARWDPLTAMFLRKNRSRVGAGL